MFVMCPLGETAMCTAVLSLYVLQEVMRVVDEKKDYYSSDDHV